MKSHKSAISGDEVANTDWMVGGMKEALVSLKDLEQAIIKKKRENSELAQLINKLREVV